MAKTGYMREYYRQHRAAFNRANSRYRANHPDSKAAIIGPLYAQRREAKLYQQYANDIERLQDIT